LGGKESGFAPDAEGRVPPCGIGHVSVFIEFLRKIGYRKQVSEHLPVRLESANAIDPGETFTAFLVSALAGARSRLARRTPRCCGRTGPCTSCWV